MSLHKEDGAKNVERITQKSQQPEGVSLGYWEWQLRGPEFDSHPLRCQADHAVYCLSQCPARDNSVPLSEIYRTYHVTDSARTGFRNCWSVCLEHPPWPCPQSELKALSVAKNVHSQGTNTPMMWNTNRHIDTVMTLTSNAFVTKQQSLVRMEGRWRYEARKVATESGITLNVSQTLWFFHIYECYRAYNDRMQIVKTTQKQHNANSI